MRTAALVVAALSFGLPAQGAITDVGDVVLSGNVLVIGNTSDGSRTVNADTDGPYDSATLGATDGVTGTLSLDGSTFTTSGAFTSGVRGQLSHAPVYSIVQLSNGSTLATGEAFVGPSTVTLESGSSWINDGPISYRADYLYNSGRNPRIAIADGANVTTQGLLAIGSQTGSDGIELSVDGPGSSWWNGGALQLSGVSSSLSVLNGATARDNGVVVGSRDIQTARVVVDGAGSTWDTGAFVWSGIWRDGDPGVFVTNGGHVTSSSASFRGLEVGFTVLVSGAGSMWSIAGPLMVTDVDSSGFSITDGGTFESGETLLAPVGTNGVGISGAESTWEINGNLTIGGSIGFVHSHVTEQGSLLVHGDTSFDIGNALADNSIGVDGTGSLFRTDGSLVMRRIVSEPCSFPNGTCGSALVVTNGGRAEVGTGVTAFESARVTLHGGTLAAPIVSLQDGRLFGEGTIEGDLTNAGVVAPGTGAGALEVNGAYEQASDGTLVIELGGTQAGIDYALLAVLGTSILAGTLEVELAAGYLPSPGDVFEVLLAGSLVGGFESYAGLDLGGGLYLVPEYRPDSFALRAVPEPTTGALVAAGLLGFALARRRA